MWQEIWPRHNKEEFIKLKEYRGLRLDANNLQSEIDGKYCIDFGCGNGNFSLALIDRGAKRVHGIDFGTDSIKYANFMSKELGYNNKTSFETKDLLKGVKKHKATTKEWFSQAKNFALFANNSGNYDAILDYLKIKK